MPRLFNIDCATLPQQVALNRDNIQQLAEWLTNNPDIGNISVTTLAPGSQATATITRRYDEETDKAYIDVTLGIPQGATGATGATGPEGPKGDPGSDLFTDFTSVKIDTSAAHVAYSNGTAHITDATLIGYKSTGNEEVECAVDIPIVAGSGVTVDANDANNAIEVSATGGGGSGKYMHTICLYLDESNHIYFNFINDKSAAYTNVVTLCQDIKTAGFASKVTALPANAVLLSGSTARFVFAIWCAQDLSPYDLFITYGTTSSSDEVGSYTPPFTDGSIHDTVTSL